MPEQKEWLLDVLEAAAKEVQSWPDWMRDERMQTTDSSLGSRMNAQESLRESVTCSGSEGDKD